ncbi:Uu.00g091760.m01.CDS01 [Anthostomella pinea]|uniref:protein O-GlcNAc transferase n=1 Tax=Anthostomella pinea TaxID=933095 RepID=A0AAI8VPB8_9PEZI|nr:Uu.00g091760.m01.CDS01 [Anthostomella pinea]
MLPLVQMHQMVHASPRIDAPSLRQPDRPHDHQRPFRPFARPSSSPGQVLGPSTPHPAFPIRTSQAQPPRQGHPRSNGLMNLPYLSEPGEHHLRRKTPSGTIDAGYDGTPAQLASGPPPLKHMILPASSKPLPAPTPLQPDFRSALHPIRSSAEGWAYRSSPSFGNLDAGGAMRPDSNLLPFRGGWPAGPANDFRSDLAADFAPNGPSATYLPYNNGVRVPTALQPTYQHPPGPAVFNNGGLLPPSPWPEAHVPGYHHVPHAAMPLYYGLNHPAMPHPRSPDALVPMGSQFNAQSPYDLVSGPYQAPSQKLESLTLESTRYNSSQVLVPHAQSPARFREKALAHAHRAHVELLAYLHHSKKSSSRSTAGTRSSSKMVIFPKLPKPLNRSFSAFSPQHPRDVQMNTDVRSDNYAMSTQLQTPTDSHMLPVMKHHSRGNEVSNPAFYHLFKVDGAHVPSVDSPRGHTIAPLSGAQAAVEMLTHLCEQSGWKWIDGMLLGGCLHYGLEHYEQSLEWFQRITRLDSHHVEAISNAAAALYCLDRHEEAESHWLQAVRRRPSYLEAVEHLVGLLCSSHRSKEAVDIINFVQRSIRLRDSRFGSTADPGATQRTNNPAQGHAAHQATSHAGSWGIADCCEESNSPGFGSSGYCVAGSENGRVIALIHAKGNMLYALKDIDRASEAFEEAVLISSGKTLNCIHSLIRRIQQVLSPADRHGNPGQNDTQTASSGPLLLPPERARHTAQLVFAANGELPGLRFVPDGVPKKSAISTTSNSLLSLAKIFQDAMSNGGSYPRLIRQPPGVGDILALYYLSLSLSESPSTANNVGILLASVQQSTSSPPQQMLEHANGPQIPGITPGSGLALALAYYNYGLKLDSKHVHLHTNLGSLLKDIGQLDLAIQMYEQAVACDGGFDIALTNLANAVKDRGRISDAIMYYKRAASANPHFAEAVCGLSTALNSVCDWRGRGGVLLGHGKYDRWHVDENGMLKDARDEESGSGLVKKVVDIVSKQLADSSHWGAGILRSGVLETIVSQLKGTAADEVKRGLQLELELGTWAGRPWEGSRLLRLVERSTKAATHRWYQDKYVHGRLSRTGYPRTRLPVSLAVPAAPTVLPFHTFTSPLTAKDIRMISHRNAARISCSTLRSSWLPSMVYPPPPPPNPQLNIGYVSSDFNNHPLAHLMQSVFGLHDPRRAKAFCYATTASDRSVHRQQIEREAPVFRDVSNWPAEKLVDQIVEDGIHILVNLNGYTRGARNEIFAARPAPIQMSFMGFAGTLGAEWCDYLLADEMAVPPSTLRPRRNNVGLEDVFRDEESSEAEDWVYSENIIFCRGTFFCCDHAQSCDADERAVTWQDEQRRRWKMRKELFPKLPDDTIILGNFNQLYKIDPSTFRTWLRILSNVPKAILWLLRFPELGESNLRRTAKAWAGEEVASRIVFTDVAPKQQHISRARVCDLFLDTPECNAHTTAADVLWSSTPLLTLPRYPYKMCSRMAASILKGALPRTREGEQAARDLIASDDADYEALATRLAGGLSYRSADGQYYEGRGRLVEMRKTLFDSKWTCALFDTHRWVSDLESAYDEAWRRWVAGEGGDIYL